MENTAKIRNPSENGLKYQNTSSRAGDPYSICLHNLTDELRAGLARGEIYFGKDTVHFWETLIWNQEYTKASVLS